MLSAILLPFLGALYVPDKTLPRGGWFPAQSAICGLSGVYETQVYITGGMSNNGAVPLMPFRMQSTVSLRQNLSKMLLTSV